MILIDLKRYQNGYSLYQQSKRRVSVNAERTLPKFLYSVFFITGGLWTVLFLVLIFTSPSSFWNILLVLFLVFLASGFTLSLPIFRVYSAKVTRSGPRLVYRKSLRWGLYAGFIISGTLGFSAYDLINILNYGLFLLFCLGIYFWLKSLR